MNYYPNRFYIVVVILYVLFGTISILTLNPHLDEVDYHYPTIVSFTENGISETLTGDGYKSASTPLPYIIETTLHNILDIVPSLASVRVINILVSFLSLLVFYFLLKETGKDILYAGLILFFYPYFIKPSFALFMAIYGLFFFLLFLIFIQKTCIANKVCAGVFLCFAILSQQFYLIILPFYALYEFYKLNKTREIIKFIKENIAFSLTLIPVVILFILWNGWTHPNFHAWGIVVRLEYITAVLLVLGGVLFPYILDKWKEFSKSEIIIAILLAVVLVVFFYPVWVNEPTLGGISGYSFHMIDIICQINFLFGNFIKILCVFVGILVLVHILCKNNKINEILKAIFIALLVGFIINRLPSERHMLPLITTAFLMTLPFSPKTVINRIWIPYQAILGIVYFYYIMFLYKIPIG